MPFGRAKIILGSLQTRLVLWNTAVVMLTVTITLVAVREGLRLRLLQEADEELLDDAEAMRLAAEELYPRLESLQHEFDRQALAHTHRRLFVQLLAHDGQVLLSSQRTPTMNVVNVETRPQGVLGSSGRYRLASRAVSLGDGTRLTIRVGASLDPVHSDVLRVSQIMVGVGVLLTLAAPFGGYWLARRATEPVGQIIDTARRLRPSRLNERLPIRGTGDELDRIASTVNALLDRIAVYLEKNREFVANAAHELRSPLAAIQGAVEVALNSDRSTEDYKELLNSLFEECASLTALVNQLLVLAEIDSGAPTVGNQTVELDKVVGKAVEMFQGIAEDRGLLLRAEALEPVAITGDAHRLRQVVNNLIDNALKFTQQGGQVTVELRATRELTPQAVLRVHDSGQGIPSADLPHVFERFFRGDKSRHREGPATGTGLGLSICQAIVQLHGGEISLESSPRLGTCVTVTLPLAEQVVLAGRTA